jgi:protocatechuate 3,4-dioxygenase beta subunit
MSHLEPHDRGLLADLRQLRATATRREALAWAAALGGAWAALGCARGVDRPLGSGPRAAGERTTCRETPSETAGPFPADGSNGPNVLDDAGVVRSDLRRSFGGPTGVAEGVPLGIELRLGSRDGCAPLVGHAVYVWQCDALGRYSLYSRGATGENYLRGVQVTDAAGRVRFTSIFPGCYPGRWPHVHFEVYADVTSAVVGARPLKTSQLALPAEACAAAYAQPGYPRSAGHLARLSLAQDGVFADGVELQLADLAAGYQATLDVTL